MALIIRGNDAQTIALSYPQSFISRFEEGVDKIFPDYRWMGFVLDLVGWLTQRLDDDAIAVEGKPDFSIASPCNIQILVVKTLDGMPSKPGISWLKSVLPVLRLCRAIPYGFNPSQKFSPSVVSMEYT